MPYINLGNLIVPPNGASVYTHKYNLGTKTHEFNGISQFGFCQCLKSYAINDKIKINNVDITEINSPEKIKAYAWIIFIVDNTKMYIFTKTASLTEYPDGSTVEPVNDIKLWCACAGINWYDIGCPDIQTITSSEEWCQQLFNNENSFNYYKRSSEIIKSTILGTNVINNLEKKDLDTTLRCVVEEISDNMETIKTEIMKNKSLLLDSIIDASLVQI